MKTEEPHSAEQAKTFREAWRLMEAIVVSVEEIERSDCNRQEALFRFLRSREMAERLRDCRKNLGVWIDDEEAESDSNAGRIPYWEKR